ncbi:uncharacterized protein FOMMEDRAFT_133463 [Fomitiporia mediterranea MF3/22]|uniref:uncharacterized protein n=1 Tax=Fomitiporia mediterranea (strain MF3/22) TaxID=694068 RepID=UPI0004408E0F|nr:uncharacterized protein FOMMEDRAFT_133463 [Fomitiporia mediterranea MF3/22]EJD04125.1 hypothetical protein FOMMEDRAFT_133463 [Fomitiporia mediterranea MF3/22]
MADNDRFQTVTSKKYYSGGRGSYSLLAECLVNTCTPNLFVVLEGLTGLVCNNCTEIKSKLRDLGDDLILASTTYQVMVLLEAIASLSVSQREREIVYIVFKITPIIDHLDSLFGLLRNICKHIVSKGQLYNMTLEETDTKDFLVGHIYQLCYTFSCEHLKKHMDKLRARKMLVAIWNLIAFLKNYSLSENQLQFLKGLNDLFCKYKVYEKGYNDPQMLDNLFELAGSTDSDRKMYQQMLDKMLTLDSSIEHLLLLPLSGSFGRILNEGVTLKFWPVLQVTTNLNYNFKTDYKLQKLMSNRKLIQFSDFVVKIKTLKLKPSNLPVISKSNPCINVHTECVIVSHIDQLEGMCMFGFICPSKLCCLECAMVVKMHNSLEGVPDSKKVYVQGIHFKQYMWVAPLVGMPCQDKLLSLIEAEMKNVFYNLCPHTKQCRTSESSTVSLSDYKVKKNWDIIINKIKKL